jgi:hypothetical protein
MAKRKSSMTSKLSGGTGSWKPSSSYTQPKTGVFGSGGGWTQPNPTLAPSWNAPANSVPAISAAPAPAAPPPPTAEQKQAAATSFLTPHATALKGFNTSARDNIFADLTKSAGYAQADYGYTGQDTNGDGIPDSGFNVDPNNPFSRAALLQKRYTEAKQGTTNSMAAQGQLYSGALQTAQDENSFQNQAGIDENQKAFNRYLDSLISGRRDASLATERENAGIDWEALVAAVNAR